MFNSHILIYFQQYKYNPGAKPFLPEVGSSSNTKMTHTSLPETSTSTPVQNGNRQPPFKNFSSPYRNGKVGILHL